MEQKIQSKSRKKAITIVIFLIIFIALIYFVWTEVSQWWEQRKQFVEMGFAEDKFPYRMYTERELVEMGRWPVESQELMNTPTRTRPEETYAKFRQALIDGDMNKTAEYFVKEKRGEILKGLENVKTKGFLQEMLDDLPERLEDIYMYNEGIEDRDLNKTALVSYNYVLKSDPERTAQTMTFVKNWDGDWLIEDL